jgi:outer membrane protein assembly factor BamA
MALYIDGRDDGRLFENGIDFNIDGNFLLQQVQFRLKESNWWLGTNYLFVSAKNTFDLSAILPPELPNPQFDFDLAALGLYVQYDSRNTVFTPSKGLLAKLDYKNFGDSWGSDFEYDQYKGTVLHYTPFGEYSSLGLRLVGDVVSGDTPFFGYPFVNLRGIPAMRYQGKSVVTAEVEYLWGFTPRWSLALFGGVGNTTDINALRGEGQTVGAGGVGFRYRLARKQGLQAGIDIARGPEDTAVYLTVGSAWAF